MISESIIEPVIAPLSGSKITDHLPPGQWAAELLYHCIRSHEERVKELQSSRSGYDPHKALEIITEVRAMLDRLLARGDIVGLKREMTFAFWERGLQPDVAEAVHNSFAKRIRDDEDGKPTLLIALKLFLPDPGYQFEGGIALYGAAALCMHLAQLAGADSNQVLKDALEQLQEPADRAA